jgi:hypothetical protein
MLDVCVRHLHAFPLSAQDWFSFSPIQLARVIVQTLPPSQRGRAGVILRKETGIISAC